jgi:two-component system alkaline phosphatase synthesis response regulator PhoP
MQSESKRILVVDDDRVMLNVVRFNFERAGFNVNVARDGSQAWNLLQTEDFDLVITDYKMPEMNGEELCRRMRQDASRRDIPVILLSAKGLELDLAHLQEELGLCEVVFKPFSPSSLVATSAA